MAGNLPANVDMVEGYLDGFKDNRADFPPDSNRSASYAHGWRNGRDDRVGTPRASAEALRTQANLAMLADELA